MRAYINMLFTYILYNFIFFGSTFFVYYSSKCKFSADKKLLLFIAFLIMFIPAALRFNIGIDYRGYVEIYNSILKYDSSYTEVGFTYFIKLLHFSNLPVESLFIITSLFIYGFIILSYKTPAAFLVNFLFVTTFYLDSFIFIRSYIVFSLTLYAIINYINNGGKTKFIIVLLLASLFHKSALILIPFIFIDNNKTLVFIKKYNLVVIFIIIVMFLFRSELSLLIINNPITNLLGYGKYIDSDHFFKSPEIGTGLGTVFKVIILSMPIILAKEILKFHPNYLLPILYIIAALISLFLSLQIFILHRIHSIFYPAYVIIPILMWPLLKSKFRQLILFFLFVVIFGSTVLVERNIIIQQSHYCEGGRTSPYVSIFNKEDDASIDVPASKCRK